MSCDSFIFIDRKDLVRNTKNVERLKTKLKMVQVVGLNRYNSNDLSNKNILEFIWGKKYKKKDSVRKSSVLLENNKIKTLNKN